MSTLLSPGSQRRLPGLRFDVPAPALREVLPRMDIACFVGFAANGPVDVPVAVESLAAFEAVFGAELTLLNDAQGQPVRALLHPCMRQFFSQGGRRAWVIRVMGTGSVTTRFPVPRMLSLGRSDAASAWHIAPAFLQARSPGDWADALRVRCDTVVAPLSVKPLKLLGDDLTLQAHGPAALGVVVGDVLRLPVAEGEWVFGRVAQADAARNDADGRLQRVLHLHRMGTLRRWQGQPQASRMHWQEPGVRAQQLVQRHADVAEAAWLADGRLRWTAHLPRLTQLEVGEPVRLSFQAGEPGAWAVIDAVQASAVAANGTVETQFVARPWRVPGSLARQPLRHWVAQGMDTTVQWLRSTLRVQHPNGSEARLDALALSERGDGSDALPTLPDDAAFFAPAQRQAFGASANMPTNTPTPTSINTSIDAPAKALGSRFPLAAAAAASSQPESLWLPLEALPAVQHDSSAGPSLQVQASADTDRGLGARGTDLPTLLRNGLSAVGWYDVFERAVSVLGNVSLALFLAMALMTLRLWELSALALPLLGLLLGQAVLMVLYAVFVTFPVLGRNYDAAVIAAGHCGFGLGATPTAIANMQAVTDRFGSSALAFLVVPMVGAFFIDIANAIVIKLFLALPVFSG